MDNCGCARWACGRIPHSTHTAQFCLDRSQGILLRRRRSTVAPRPQPKGNTMSENIEELKAAAAAEAAAKAAEAEAARAKAGGSARTARSFRRPGRTGPGHATCPSSAHRDPLLARHRPSRHPRPPPAPRSPGTNGCHPDPGCSYPDILAVAIAPLSTVCARASGVSAKSRCPCSTATSWSPGARRARRDPRPPVLAEGLSANGSSSSCVTSST